MAKTYYSRKNVLSMAAKRGARRSAYRSLTRRLPSRLNAGRVGDGVSRIVTVNKSYFIEDALTSQLTGAVYLGLDFKLSDISDYTFYQNVYEQYRINSVKVTLVPKVNAIGATPTVGAIPSLLSYSPQCGLLGTAIDFDQGTINSPFTTMSQMVQADTFKFTRGTDLHTRTFKPGCMTALSNTANGTLTTGGAPVYGQWIHMGAPSVPHYGLRIMVEDSDVIALSYDIIIKYNISFKCTH